MSKLIYVQAQSDHIASLFRGSPLSAIEELVWNALDADAHEVKVDLLTNPMGGVDAVRVSDDGSGIDIIRVDATFGSLGGSWKREARGETARHRRLHGRNGRGRFKAFALGCHAEWRTTVCEGGALMSYRLSGEADQPGVFELATSDTGPACGTEVLITNVRANVDALLDAGETVQALASKFALYLKSYPDVRIYFNGLPVTPVVVQKRTTDYRLALANGAEAKLEIIEWKRKFMGSGRLVLTGPDGFQLHEVTTNTHSGGASYTAYLIAPRFVALHAENALVMDELNPEVRLYLDEARRVMRAHFAAYAADREAEVIRAWETRFAALTKREMRRVYEALGKIVGACALIFATLAAPGAWYWPFGDDEDAREEPRLSELMEPATTNIDAAADFAADGKIKEAQECYRAAIEALNRIERDNPERAATPEFASVRNKRAYVNAALDSLLLAEARDHAKAVSVTDTTALEVKIVLRPWKAFEENHTALTNADRLVGKRLDYLAKPELRALIADIQRELEAKDPLAHRASVSNQLAIQKAKVDCAAAREQVKRVRAAAQVAVARLERFSEAVQTAESVRIFDVCRADARQAIAACTKAWPAYGQALDRLNRNAQGLYALLPDSDEVRAAWGGEEASVPTKADDRGLVTNEGDARPEVTSQVEAYVKQERQHSEKVNARAEKVKATRQRVQREVEELLEKDSKSRRARMLQASEDLRNGRLQAAKEKVDDLLEDKPNDGPALNLRAAIEAAGGDLKAAEKTLDQAIQSNPRDYHGYYNMAAVYLQNGNADGARRYYETGRGFGGPKDPDLEKAVRK